MHIPIALDTNAVLPQKAHVLDAGFDLYSTSDVTIPSHDSAIIDTGVHMCIPAAYCGLLVSKSGLNTKHSLTSTGLIDSGYTGSIKVKLYNHGYEDYTVHKGDKVSQIVLLPILDNVTLHVVDTIGDLPETERGSNGFGSSGK